MELRRSHSRFENMPKMDSGKMNGEPVRVMYSLPITIQSGRYISKTKIRYEADLLNNVFCFEMVGI
jgi:hypothetical protein